MTDIFEYTVDDLGGFTDGDPVFMVLHGVGSSELQVRSIYTLAWPGSRARLICVRGPEQLGPANFQWFNQIPGDHPGNYLRLSALRVLMTQFVQNRQIEVPNSRFIIGGWSQGITVGLDQLTRGFQTVFGTVGWVLTYPDTPIARAFPAAVGPRFVEAGHAIDDPFVPIDHARGVRDDLVAAGYITRDAACNDDASLMLREIPWSMHTPPPPGAAVNHWRSVFKHDGCA